MLFRSSVDDLRGKVVGVQMGSASEQVADKMESLKKVRHFNYNPEAFLDLQNKRIDALIVGYAYAVNQIRTTSGGFHVLSEVGEPFEVKHLPSAASIKYWLCIHQS